MATWGDLIELVFRDSGVLGVGQTLQAQDTADAVKRFNMMIAQWKRRRWLVYHLVSHSIPMDGSLNYTIGIGGDINTPRPDQIESAFVRQVTQAQPNRPDFPLRLIHAYEEYSQIALKGLRAGPAWVLFYDSGYPLGTLYPYPLMSSQYELHIQIKAELDSVGLPSDEVILPEEYHLAIYANQMKMTRSAYRLPPDKDINDLAKVSLETIRSSNFQISRLNMPSGIRTGGGYNAYSDSWGPGYRR